MANRGSAIHSGVVLAVLAAVSFGATIPVIAHAGRGVGALTTAALLYGGACLSSLLLSLVSRRSGAPLLRGHVGRLLAMALVGAGIAPTLLAWGLQRSGATAGALLLNLEAVFTVLLARALYREPIGRRVALALTLMAIAGVALTLQSVRIDEWNAIGALAVIGATVAWALDNTLSRGLAEQDPVLIVAGKGGLGFAMTFLSALVLRESRPALGAALILLACGATGYGLSLRLYLLAQRRMGAARTGSVFAIAPFVGAALAWGIGDQSVGVWTVAAAALFATGVWLHITERHHHSHVHPSVEHEHVHRHDDAHHDHMHDPPVLGEHSHAHRHDRLEHEHDHAPDIHHDHVH